MRKRNVAKSVSHPHIYEYIDDRLRAAYLYFGNPQTKTGPLFSHADVDRLQKRLRENLKHRHELSQGPVSSPLPETGKATKEATSHQDNTRKQMDKNSVKEERGKSMSPELNKFMDQLGKSVLDGAISAVNSHIHSVTPAGNLLPKRKADSTSSVEVLEKGMSSLLIEDSLESKKTVPDDGNKSQQHSQDTETGSDSEHSEKEYLAEHEKTEVSDESEESDESDHEEGSKVEETDKDLNNSSICSPTHTRCNGGIKGLYDESLLYGLREQDFAFTFEEEVLFDGKVKLFHNLKRIHRIFSH